MVGGSSEPTFTTSLTELRLKERRREMQRRLCPFLRRRRMAPRVCLSSISTTSWLAGSQLATNRANRVCSPGPPECERKTKRRHGQAGISDSASNAQPDDDQHRMDGKNRRNKSHVACLSRNSARHSGRQVGGIGRNSPIFALWAN